MKTCTRKLEFDYGHRLLNHESKCAHAHGHRGMVEITCGAESLDKAGRVIDFGEIKALVGGWIDDNLDHAFIVNRKDETMLDFLVLESQRTYAMDCEPSAENLVQHIAEQATRLLGPRGIMVVRVRFYETPNGWADWEA